MSTDSEDIVSTEGVDKKTWNRRFLRRSRSGSRLRTKSTLKVTAATPCHVEQANIITESISLDLDFAQSSSAA